MPRSTARVFKKMKNVGKKKETSTDEATCSTAVSTPSRSPSECSSRSSSSSKKLEGKIDEYTRYEDSSQKYDVIDIGAFSTFLSSIASCKECGGVIALEAVKRAGLAMEVFAKCTKCKVSGTYQNSKKIDTNIDGAYGQPLKQKKVHAINVRFVYALRAIGKGLHAGKVFCGMMNLPAPIAHFEAAEHVIRSAAEVECAATMKEAVEDAVTQNGGSKDLAIALDGTWQKRGYKSLNGIVTATSVDNTKIIDIAIMSKFCMCPERLKQIHLEDCKANFQGVSGAMEVQGVLDIFRRSEALYGVRYTSYLGDGDSKGHKAVVEEKIYGPDTVVEKLECVGHVQKRMGTRLRALKQSMKGKLSDNKPLGGKNRLTEAAINKIQNFYGLAIRRNTGNLDEMKKAVWAVFFHIASSNEEPVHGLCPPGEDSWCKYRKAQVEGTSYDHKAHFHISPVVMNVIKPIFRDLAHPELLKKCLHGGTQNPNESANNAIWSRIPKNTFVRLKTLQLGTFDAVGCFNIGNIVRCRIFERMGIEPGAFCTDALERLDVERIKKAQKAVDAINQKARQKRTLARRKLEDEFEKTEDPDDPSYGAGMH